MDASSPIPSGVLAQSGETEARAHGKAVWRIVPLLCLCFLAAYIDRVNVGFAKLQMLSDLKWGEATFGLGAGLFFVGYVAFEIPSNLALARVGARIWIARIMVTWGIATVLMAWVTTPSAYYGLRFLLGVAEAGFMPGVLYYLAIWFPAWRRGRIIGLFMLGIPLSSVVGAPLSGYILSNLGGVLGFKAWQWLFLIEALPSIALGLVVYVCLPGPVQAVRWLTQPEKQAIVHAVEKERHGDEVSLVLQCLRDGRVWLVGLVDAAILLGLYSITFWLPTLIRQGGIKEPSTIGLLTAIPHIAAAISMVLIGRSSDRLRERRWHIAVPMIAGAAALAIAASISDGVAFRLVFLTLANALTLGAIPPLWSVPGQFLRGPAAAGGFALANSIANVGGFVATYFVGWMLDLGFSAAVPLYCFAVCLVLGGLAALRLPVLAKRASSEVRETLPALPGSGGPGFPR